MNDRVKSEVCEVDRLPITSEGKSLEQIAKVITDNELLEACKLAEQLITRINYAFYVDGKTKALLPVMAETKPALAVLRAAIANKTP